MANNNTSVIDVDAEIDRILSEYEKTLKANHSLLLRNRFKLPNSSFVVECGLCPIRNFSPTILLRKHGVEMVFTTQEWSQLISELEKLYNTFLFPTEINADSHMYSPIFIGDYTTVDKIFHTNVKQLMLMQQLTSLYLSDIDISEICKINLSLVSHRIALLSSLNFKHYYNNILNSFIENNSNSRLNMIEVLKIFCECTDNSLLSNALREYIYFL